MNISYIILWIFVNYIIISNPKHTVSNNMCKYHLFIFHLITCTQSYHPV